MPINAQEKQRDKAKMNTNSVENKQNILCAQNHHFCYTFNQ